MIRFVDPRAEPSAPAEPYRLGFDGAAGRLVVGMLANGFPDSGAFARALGEALGRARPGIDVRHWLKPDDSVPAAAAELDVIAAEVAVAITLYGH